MEQDLKWVIGVGTTLTVALVTTLIGSFRNLNSKISTGNKELYSRIDRVKEQYVRRDDLDNHLQRIDASLHEMREEMRRNNEQVLNAIAQSKK